MEPHWHNTFKRRRLCAPGLSLFFQDVSSGEVYSGRDTFQSVTQLSVKHEV